MNENVYCICDTALDRTLLVEKALEYYRKELPDKISGNIVIKPNFLSYKFLEASTHPNVLKSVVRFFRYKYPTNEIIVAEGSHVVNRYVKRYKIDQMVRHYDVHFLSLNTGNEWELFKLIDLEGNYIWTRFSSVVYNSGFLVSLTLPKVHGNVGLTSAQKNLVGCIHYDDRCHVHGLHENIPDKFRNRYRRRVYDRDTLIGKMAMSIRNVIPLSETEKRIFSEGIDIVRKNLRLLHAFKQPDLSIIDGYHVMEGNGPWHGNSVFLKTVIIGENVIASDVTMANLLHRPISELGYITDKDLAAYKVNNIYPLEYPIRFYAKPHCFMRSPKC